MLPTSGAGGRPDLPRTCPECRFIANSRSLQLGQDLHRVHRERLRFSRLSLRPGRFHRGRKDHRAVRRTCHPALRARTGGGFGLRPAWVVRAALGQVGTWRRSPRAMRDGRRGPRSVMAETGRNVGSRRNSVGPAPCTYVPPPGIRHPHKGARSGTTKVNNREKRPRNRQSAAGEVPR